MRGGCSWRFNCTGHSLKHISLSNCSDPFFTLDTILVVCSYMHAVPTFYQVAICFKEGKKQYSLYDVTYLHVEVKSR